MCLCTTCPKDQTGHLSKVTKTYFLSRGNSNEANWNDDVTSGYYYRLDIPTSIRFRFLYIKLAAQVTFVTFCFVKLLFCSNVKLGQYCETLNEFLKQRMVV